jgi:hypothetical protein
LNSPKLTVKGFLEKAERWVAPESVERYQWCGAIRHAITNKKLNVRFFIFA